MPEEINKVVLVTPLAGKRQSRHRFLRGFRVEHVPTQATRTPIEKSWFCLPATERRFSAKGAKCRRLGYPNADAPAHEECGKASRGDGRRWSQEIYLGPGWLADGMKIRGNFARITIWRDGNRAIPMPCLFKGVLEP